MAPWICLTNRQQRYRTEASLSTKSSTAASSYAANHDLTYNTVNQLREQHTMMVAMNEVQYSWLYKVVRGGFDGEALGKTSTQMHRQGATLQRPLLFIPIELTI